MAMNNRLLRPRASGGFDPKSISGLIMWLDASDSSTITPASAPLADTGAITTWADKSGLGQSMGQSSAVNRPTYAATGVGGKPAIAFAAASSQFMAGTFSHALTQMSSYVVAVLSGGDRVVSLNVSGQTSDFAGTNAITRLKRTSSTSISIPYSGTDNAVARTFTEGVPFISSAFHDGSTLSHKVNNGAAATLASSMNTTYGHMVLSSLFRTSYSAGFTGSIAEIIFYNRFVSSAEDAAIASYLSAKYGIAIA